MKMKRAGKAKKERMTQRGRKKDGNESFRGRRVVGACRLNKDLCIDFSMISLMSVFPHHS